MSNNKDETKHEGRKRKRGVGVYKNKDIDSKSEIFKEKLNLEEFENETLKVDRSSSTIFEETNTQDIKIIDLNHNSKKSKFFNKQFFRSLSLMVVFVIIVVILVKVI